HPHCLRHSCGYALADRGVDLRTIQEWLGHRSIEMTVRYTRISQRRFNGLLRGYPPPRGREQRNLPKKPMKINTWPVGLPLSHLIVLLGTTIRFPFSM